jgi:hypothetical protein
MIKLNHHFPFLRNIFFIIAPNCQSRRNQFSTELKKYIQIICLAKVFNQILLDL